MDAEAAWVMREPSWTPRLSGTRSGALVHSPWSCGLPRVCFSRERYTRAGRRHDGDLEALFRLDHDDGLALGLVPLDGFGDRCEQDGRVGLGAEAARQLRHRRVTRLLRGDGDDASAPDALITIPS